MNSTVENRGVFLTSIGWKIQQIISCANLFFTHVFQTPSVPDFREKKIVKKTREKEGFTKKGLYFLVLLLKMMPNLIHAVQRC